MIGRITGAMTGPPRRVPQRWRLPALVFAVCQLTLLIWWAAFYPGLMSYDSMSYVWHVTENAWMANHSVAYDGLVWISLKLTGDLSVLTFAQTVGASVVLAYTADTLHALGVRARWAALATVAVPVLPPLGSFLVFVWKDVPFTISALLIFAVTARILVHRRAGERPGWRLIALLALGFLGLVLFRNNGFLVALIAAPVLILTLSGLRRAVAIATVVPIALSFLLTGVVYPAMDIEGARPSLTYATAYADVAVAYAERPEKFTAADTALMAQVAPLSHWKYAGGNCYNSDWLTHRPAFSRAAADRVNDRLVTLWKTTIQRSPVLVTRARLCRASIAWAILPGPKRLDARTKIAATSVPKNRFGWARTRYSWLWKSPELPILKIRPLSWKLNHAAGAVERASRTPSLEWLLWRGALWCYLAYIAIALFARARRMPAALSLGAILLGLQLCVVAANPAQLFRYMAAALIIGITALPLFTLVRRDPDEREPRSDDEGDRERPGAAQPAGEGPAVPAPNV